MAVTRGSCEGFKATTQLQSGWEVPPGFSKLPEQILLHCSFNRLLLFHSIITQCLKFSQTLLVKALHGFPEGCVPHPQVEMQPHYTRTSENLWGICRSSVNDSHQAHLIHFLHLSKHLLIFFYLSHKASAISLPGSVFLPLVPVILPADSTAAHPEHFKHTHSPFQASFHSLSGRESTWTLSALYLRPHEQLSSHNAGISGCGLCNLTPQDSPRRNSTQGVLFSPNLLALT